MLRTRLLTATAAFALFAAPAVLAQDASTVATPPMPQAPATSPAPVPAEPSPATTATTPATAGTVIDTLKARGQFTTLLAALDAAQLTATLQSQPAISIFAPTDAAFAALPEADRTRLMDPANVNELRQTLLYHVIVADVNSSQIQGAKGGVETAARSQVELDGTGTALKVGDATIVEADIEASNGAVFVIDKVLSPAATPPAAVDAAAPPAADASEMPAGEDAAPDDVTPVAAPTPPVEADADADATPAPVPTPQG